MGRKPAGMRFRRRSDFFDDGLCKGMDTELWFPSLEALDACAGSQRLISQLYAEGKAVCEECPVAWECGEWAARNNVEYGMFGGFMPHERRMLLRRGHWDQPKPSTS